MPTYLDGEKKWKFWITVIKVVVGLVMSIYSFYTTVRSFNLLDDIRVEYGDLIDHWNREPLQGMVIVDASQDCPDGYTEGAAITDEEQLRDASQTVGVWQGTDNWCDCPLAGATYTYTVTVSTCTCSGATTTGSCSSSARDRGCRTGSRQEQRTDTFFTESGTCETEADNNGCTNDRGADAVQLRSWKGRRLCYQSGGEAPIERPVMTVDGECPEGSVTCGVGTYTENNATCQASIENCPVTGISAFPTLSNNSDFSVISAIDEQAAGLPIVEFRMTIGRPCLRGTEGDATRRANQRETASMDEACELVDDRYEIWDSYTESLLFDENNVPTTGGHNVGTSGTEVSPLQDYTTNDVEWFLSFRREIEWDPACEAGTIAVLRDNRDPLAEMTSLQKSLMVVNGIFGLAILGILFSVLYLVQYFDDDRDMPCIPGKGSEELKNLDRIKEVVGMIAKIAKFVPLVLCLLVTNRIASFFLTAAEAACSDDRTNASLVDVGTQVARVRDSNYQTLAIDIAMFLLQFILWGWEWHKKRNSDDNPKELDDESDHVPLEEQCTPENGMESNSVNRSENGMREENGTGENVVVNRLGDHLMDRVENGMELNLNSVNRSENGTRESSINRSENVMEEENGMADMGEEDGMGDMGEEDGMGDMGEEDDMGYMGEENDMGEEFDMGEENVMEE